MFHYATTRDYSNKDENWDEEKEEEAFETYWRGVLGLDEEENIDTSTENGTNAGTDSDTNNVTTRTTGLVDGSSEETPEIITPPLKLSLRFKEVHCTTLLALRQIFSFSAIILF